LAGHGFYWFKLTEGAAAPSWHEEFFAPEPPPWLVLFDSLASFTARGTVERQDLARRLIQQLEGEVLPRYMRQQRWFAAKDEALENAGLADACLWRTERGEWLMTTVEARFPSGQAQTYFLPLAIDWGEERPGREQAAALARVRQRAETGILFDAFAQEEFVRDLIARIASGEQGPLGCGRGTLTFEATRALETLLPPDLDAAPVRRRATEGTTSAFLIGEQLFLKAYRRLRRGVNPEWEMGRFLTEVSPCPAVVAVAGAIEYHGEDGWRATLALLQAATKNQGDGWTFTSSYLERFLDDALARAPESSAEDAARHADYLVLIRTLAQRTADLHRALAVSTGDPAFEPEPFEADALSAWVDRIGA